MNGDYQWPPEDDPSGLLNDPLAGQADSFTTARSSAPSGSSEAIDTNVKAEQSDVSVEIDTAAASVDTAETFLGFF